MECFCDCVSELWGGESEKLEKVVDVNVYKTVESEEYGEEVEGIVIWGGGEEFIIMPVVCPRGPVSVSSLCYFLSPHIFLFEQAFSEVF